MTVTLTNSSGRLATFVLAHDTYCAKAARCACTQRRDGVRIAGSLTLAARASAKDVDAAAVGLPAIRAAIRSGALRVDAVPAAPKPISVATPSPSPTHPEGGPEGAPTTPVEVPDERRAAVVEDHRR
jgi:hypothetical protein